jgi:hypothetical protein
MCTADTYKNEFGIIQGKLGYEAVDKHPAGIPGVSTRHLKEQAAPVRDTLQFCVLRNNFSDWLRLEK